MVLLLEWLLPALEVGIYVCDVLRENSFCTCARIRTSRPILWEFDLKEGLTIELRRKKPLRMADDNCVKQ